MASPKIAYELIDSEQTALGRLTLHRYAADSGEVGYEIRIDDQFLMASHGAHGEVVMAALAHRRLERPTNRLRVLVGGLGAGHTLRAALDLPAVVSVEVVEIGAKVIEWNRRYFSAANGRALDDPRLSVRHAALGAWLARRGHAYDLLLLDVDNGPGWLAAEGNAPLYTPAGLRDCRAALRLGGVLAVWSPQPNRAFGDALAEVFEVVETVTTAEQAERAGALPDTVYLASH